MVVRARTFVPGVVALWLAGCTTAESDDGSADAEASSSATATTDVETGSGGDASSTTDDGASTDGASSGDETETGSESGTETETETGDETTDDGTTGEPQPGCSAEEVFANDFNDDAVGPYADVIDWNDPPWDSGIDEGRADIIEGADAFEGRSLRIHYPQGGVGPGEGGVQWQTPLGDSYDELYLSYRVRFGEGFDFVLGGKLPGLVGGTSPTGCVQDDTGFSARGMWRTGGAAVQYMYWPEKVSNCGDDYDYEDASGPVHFQPGVWHTVQTRVRINTPGESDGVLQAWLDGELVLDVQDFLYRTAEGTYAVDGMYFSTFFGGSSAEWGPTADETIDFDDFVICTGPIVN